MRDCEGGGGGALWDDRPWLGAGTRRCVLAAGARLPAAELTRLTAGPLGPCGARLGRGAWLTGGAGGPWGRALAVGRDWPGV